MGLAVLYDCDGFVGSDMVMFGSVMAYVAILCVLNCVVRRFLVVQISAPLCVCAGSGFIVQV